MVRVLAAAPRGEPRALAAARRDRGAGPGGHPGAAAQRMAGPVPRSDARPVPPSAGARDVPTALTIGPWTHTQMMTKGGPTVIRETLEWLGTHLASGGQERSDPGSAPRRTPAEIRCASTSTGTAGSICPEWPPATEHRDLYLLAGGRLGDAPLDDPGSDVELHLPPRGPPPRRSVGGCCPRPAVTATTRHWPPGPMCSPSPASRCRPTSTPSASRCWRSHTAADNPHHDVFVRISEVDPRAAHAM